jgi:uncharacterized protein
MLEDKIQQDLKQALLGGDKTRAEVLRGLRSVLLNEKIARGLRDSGLSDDQVLALIGKEAKKRTESAELYQKAGANDRAEAELNERAVLEDYLPSQLSDEQLGQVAEEVINGMGPGVKLGQAIAAVRQKVGASADGGRIAAAVKAKLEL